MKNRGTIALTSTPNSRSFIIGIVGAKGSFVRCSLFEPIIEFEKNMTSLVYDDASLIIALEVTLVEPFCECYHPRLAVDLNVRIGAFVPLVLLLDDIIYGDVTPEVHEGVDILNDDGDVCRWNVSETILKEDSSVYVVDAEYSLQYLKQVLGWDVYQVVNAVLVLRWEQGSVPLKNAVLSVA